MKTFVTIMLCVHVYMSTTVALASAGSSKSLGSVESTPPQNSPASPKAPLDHPMIPVVHAYINIQESLAGDHLQGVHQAARKILANLGPLKNHSSSTDSTTSKAHLYQQLQSHAKALLTVTNLKATRATFYELSYTITTWAASAKPNGFTLAFCPMAQGGEGAGWLQKKGPLRNPYFGSSMLECGQFIPWQ